MEKKTKSNLNRTDSELYDAQALAHSSIATGTQILQKLEYQQGIYDYRSIIELIFF
jgi:hypothetical protein